LRASYVLLTTGIIRDNLIKKDMADLFPADIGKLSGPLTEFIKRVSRAIGILYEPHRIVRKAKAEATAKVIHAGADAEAKAISERAALRNKFILNRQQTNLEQIVKLALPAIDQSKEPQNMEEDWLIQFMNAAQDVSDIDLQSLWAKLLAGEYNQKGTFSIRTIHAVRLLRKAEAETINRFFGLVSVLNQELYCAIHIKPNRLQAFQITDLVVGQLKDIGIVSETMHFVLTSTHERHIMKYFGREFVLSKSDSVHYEPALVFYLLSSIGKELFSVAVPERNDSYLSQLLEYFKIDSIAFEEK
jgi:hypothetical protein